MKKIPKRILAALILTMPAVATAIPVDLSDWTADGGSSSWNIQPGNDTVLQTVNGAPTIFYNPNVTSTQGTALSGTISVQETSDNDFIGFVLGYDAGEVFANSADYYLLDWKQGDQSGWDEGMTLSHIKNGSNGNTTGTSGSFWQHTPGEVDVISRASTLGDTGWTDFQSYTFNIVFTADLISVTLNGTNQFNITPADVAGISSFDDGSFGFYNYSQPNVLYSGIVQTDCTTTPNAPECQDIIDPPPSGDVPVPGTVLLLGIGLAGLGWSSRRGSRA